MNKEPTIQIPVTLYLKIANCLGALGGANRFSIEEICIFDKIYSKAYRKRKEWEATKEKQE